MDDFDFLDGLSSPQPDGEECLQKLKTAGVFDATKRTLQQAIKAVKANPGAAAMIAGGALAAGAGQYMMSRPGKDGLSMEQKLTRAEESAFERDDDAKKDESFPYLMARAHARSASQFADVFAKHPGKSAIAPAVAGASAAAWLASKLIKK